MQVALETLSSVRTVRAYGTEKREFGRFFILFFLLLNFLMGNLYFGLMLLWEYLIISISYLGISI